MNSSLRLKLDALRREFPRLFAVERPTASEVNALFVEFGRSFNRLYADFLGEYGAAIVGPLRIYGLRSVEATRRGWDAVDLNRHFRVQGWPHAEEWMIVSTDLAGNPIGLREDGAVVTYDHDSGELLVLANDFDQFLERGCIANI